MFSLFCLNEGAMWAGPVNQIQRTEKIENQMTEKIENQMTKKMTKRPNRYKTRWPKKTIGPNMQYKYDFTETN